MEDWTPDLAKQLYNIPHWSGGYFDVNPLGNLVVNRERDTQNQGIDLYRLVDEIKSTGLSLPCLVRFPHILHDRAEHLKKAFQFAIESHQYQAEYRPVYPIKVNQEQSVVTELLKSRQVGLEAGSKPELMAVLALAQLNNGVIVCNGYKDREYIRLALIGRKLGHKIYIVLEKPSEIDLVIKEASSMQITPMLGIRIRLDSIGNSKWQNTGGEKSKFGFSSSQTLEAIAKLQQNGLLENLELLHFHLGSQITNIEDIHKGATECSRYYVALRRAGAHRLDTIDVGGGLGIDYEGTRSRSYFSMNYSINDYASTVISTIAKITDQEGISHPHIVTESGRAMVAHHAMMVIEVIETEQMISTPDISHFESGSDSVESLKSLLDKLRDGQCQILECYHNANQKMANIKQLFNDGVLNLKDRAACEQYYYELCSTIRNQLNSDKKSQRDTMDELNEKLADKYFCNFSLFQSLPDIWAINQIFPIVPLHRLNEKPLQRGTIHDITCDSDGRIDSYVDNDGVEASLPLHPLVPGQPYYLGVFLVGAYQEILGDLHNLFGDTNSVNVELDNGEYRITQPNHGDSVEFVLKYVHYDIKEFVDSYKNKLSNAKLSQQQYHAYLSELESGLTGYTYLEE